MARGRKFGMLLATFVLVGGLMGGCSAEGDSQEIAGALPDQTVAAEDSAADSGSRNVPSEPEENPGNEAGREAGPTAAPAQPDSATPNASGESEATMFYIHVNGEALAVTPAENSSAQALLDLLADGDVMVAAHDYGNFEKVGALPQLLPTNDEPITTEPGDVILYQGNQITVYYDANNWNFTRLGKIEGVDASDLKRILGDGDAELRLSLRA